MVAAIFYRKSFGYRSPNGSRAGTFRAFERFPRMNKMTTDLRAAAASARAFADSAGSAELKQSFYAMATRDLRGSWYTIRHAVGSRSRQMREEGSTSAELPHASAL